MRFPAYFADGCTQPGFLAAAERLYGPLRFSYRPTLAADRGSLVEASARLTAQEFDLAVAEFMVGKLVTWDLVDSEEKNVPLTAVELGRLQPEAFARLFRIIGGWEPSDLDPAWSDEQTSDHLADLREASASGSLIGEVREERDAKN